MQFLADASTKSHPSSLASALPSWVETSRSVTRSHLLPTNMTGAGPYDPDPSEDALSGEPGYEGEPDCEDSFTR